MIALDSGALIAVERRDAEAVKLIKAATKERQVLLISTAVIAEVWRSPPSVAVARLLQSAHIATADEAIARAAGAAIGATGASTVDALVAATAHRFRAPLLTADHDAMTALATHFGGLRLIVL